MLKIDFQYLFSIGKALCYCLTWNNFNAQNIHNTLIINYRKAISYVIQGFIYNIFIIDNTRVRTHGFSNYKLIEKACELLNLLSENDIEDIKQRIIDSLNTIEFVISDNKTIAELNKVNEKEEKYLTIQFFNNIKEVYERNIDKE